MDPFSLLPPSVFLKIVKYLPLKDRIRVGRVNKTFQRWSTTAISDMKQLEFSVDSGDFIKLSPESFSKLINLCSKNLESAELYQYDEETKDIMEIVKNFSQISFPNLTELCLGYYVHQNVELDEPMWKSVERDEIFADIIRRNPNLKKLEIYYDAAPFPNDVVCERLEDLFMGSIDNETLNSLIGRCPNLQDFWIWSRLSSSTDTYSNFFASSPKIRRLRFDINLKELYAVESLWRLPLIELNDYSLVDDDDMIKIAASFPHMESLEFSEVDFSGRGLAALKSLKFLKRLCVEENENGVNSGFDEELRYLALECPALETIVIYYAKISTTTLKLIVQYCPQIQYLRVARIAGVKTVDDARLVAESLPRVENRKLRVHINNLDCRAIWNSNEIKEIFSTLGSDIGQSIQIGYR